MRAYHLLSSEHALSDIALQRMKIATFSDLNDPFELLALSLGLEPIRNGFTEWKRELSKDNGLLCFSRKWESPVLWSHYGAKHTGMALGFDIEDSSVDSVKYADQRMALPVVDDTLEFDEPFMRRLLLTKFKHWEYEDEVRVFVRLDHQTIEGGRYFYDFCNAVTLREVVLGPLCEIPTTAVCSMVGSLYRGVDVIKAELAYKWYKVVPGKTYKIEKDAARVGSDV
jgi:hypothetical protein